MIKGTYELAGLVVEIRSVYDGVHRLWRAYASDGDPSMVVETTVADIEYERAKALRSAAREGRTETSDDEMLEALAVYRAVAEHMTECGVLLFHGSAIALDGAAYIFTAPSGTGKSTHTALWRKVFGDRAVMVNDDKPMIRVTPDGAFVFGTPYNGKHRLGCNTVAPLKAICLLERGANNAISEIDWREAYNTIIQQTFRPRSNEALARTLGLLDELAKHVRFYRLACNMEEEAAIVAYEGMKGDTQ